MSAEKLFCEIIKEEFDKTISLLELAMITPKFALERAKAIYNGAYTLLYKAVEAQISLIETYLKKILEINNGKNKDSFLGHVCATAYSCKPLTDLMFSSKYVFLFGGSTSLQNQAKNDYSLFERFVCQQATTKLLEDWTASTLDAIKILLDTAKNKMPGTRKLDEALDKYMKALEDSGVIHLLNEIKKYEQCAFEVCKWSETVRNQEDNFLSKNSLIEVGDGIGWAVDISKGWINKLYIKDKELTLKLVNLDAELSLYRSNGVTNINNIKLTANSKSLSDMLS